MDEQMVAVGGRALQVSSVGSGPVTLVILSGSNILFPGLEYAPLADALREWYSVLIPSKFGYGFSDLTEAPRTEAPFSSGAGGPQHGVSGGTALGL